MKGPIWVDAQLPPALARWLTAEHQHDAHHVQDLGFLTAPDRVIFSVARTADAVMVTKNSDFVRLHEEQGSPPQVVWVTCGNRSNAELLALFATAWPRAVQLLAGGEPLVEIGGG